jgi:hypothetical protein
MFGQQMMNRRVYQISLTVDGKCKGDFHLDLIGQGSNMLIINYRLLMLILAAVGGHASISYKSGKYAKCLVRGSTLKPIAFHLVDPAAILVLGGDKSEVELIDFTTGGAKSCISTQHAPHSHSKAAGIWIDDKPTICGGGDTFSATINSDCHSYNLKTGQWNQASSLLVNRKV